MEKKITAGDLAGTKIRVTPEQSVRVRELANNLGYKGLSDLDQIQIVSKSEHALYFLNGRTFWSLTKGEWEAPFKNHNNREIHYTDLFPEPTPPEAINAAAIIRQAFHGFSDEQWAERQFQFPYSEISFIVNRIMSGLQAPPEAITPEALEREGFIADNGRLHWTKGNVTVYAITETDRMEVWVWDCIAQGTTTMPELRMLCKLMNGEPKPTYSPNPETK